MSELFTLSILRQGGVVMIPIGLASVVALAYIIYCSLMLRRKMVLPPPLIAIAENLSASDSTEESEAICRREGGPFAEILLTVLATRKASREEAESLVESAGRRAEHDLSHGLLVLEVVAAVSPLLGLLGTVTGMYEVFRKIAHVGVQQAGQLSGGISEALVTTIAGLIVAIPAYVAYTWFSRRVDDLVLEMERYAVVLMTRLRSEG